MAPAHRHALLDGFHLSRRPLPRNLAVLGEVIQESWPQPDRAVMYRLSNSRRRQFGCKPKHLACVTFDAFVTAREVMQVPLANGSDFLEMLVTSVRYQMEGV
jgi:hypothetical protein